MWANVWEKRETCASWGQEEVLVGAEEVGNAPTFVWGVVPGRAEQGRHKTKWAVRRSPHFPQQVIPRGLWGRSTGYSHSEPRDTLILQMKIGMCPGWCQNAISCSSEEAM